MAADGSSSHLIADEAELRQLYGEVSPGARRKAIPFLDKHCRRFIELSPFLTIGTFNAEGKADVSPRGDPAGFVKVLDDRTLAIPDRPGNNRLDTLSNILSNPTVGLLFLIPGFEETLRVNGKAVLSRDPALLQSMAVNEKTPKLAIVVTMEEAFLHCAKAFKRSRLWDPTAQVDRKVMPGLIRMILEQTEEAKRMADAEIDAMDEKLEEHYKHGLY